MNADNLPVKLEKILKEVVWWLILAGIVVVIGRYGFNPGEKYIKFLNFLAYSFSSFLTFQFFLRLICSHQGKKFIKQNKKELILIFLFAAALFSLRLRIISDRLLTLENGGYPVICQIFIVAFFILRLPNYYKLLFFPRLSPPLIVVSTFLVIIVIGTFFLILPVSTSPGKSTHFLDALFTATSATCVTGLIVVDTGSHFSTFGQIVILTLIQMGGLGLMTFASLFAILSGGLGLRERVILRDIVRFQDLGKIGYLILYIFLLTFIFEATGAVLLYFQFLPGAETALSALYSAIFHSISAFCNAGFSIYRTSFMQYQMNLAVNLIMTFLIIGGGLGFVVIIDLLGLINSWVKKRKGSLSLHSKLVIFTTIILILTGTFFLYIGESGNLLKDLSFKGKILTSYFQSVTARTAGFNTIPVSSLTAFSSFLLIILMFIGASPGSTGGGIKTSTFATLILTIKSMIGGKEQVEAFKRTIPQTFVYQTLCVVTLALGWSCISALLLSFTEQTSFLNILFEVFSALGTVGLSRGITPELTIWGKIIIIVTIFIGRIGPLTLALAIAGKKVTRLYEYPKEGIIIG